MVNFKISLMNGNIINIKGDHIKPNEDGFMMVFKEKSVVGAVKVEHIIYVILEAIDE